MTEKQYCAESAKIETAKSEAKLALVRRKLELGFKKLEADVEKAAQDLVKAKLTREEEYDALKLAVREAELDLERARAYEQNAREVAEKGFEQ